MSEKDPPQLGVHRIVMPWCDIVQEEIMRRKGGSFTVAFGWSIGWNGEGWQVFYRAICAEYRLRHKRTREHETFRKAYEWIEGLSAEQFAIIESRVKA